VPEAAIEEHGDPVAAEHDVGSAWDGRDGTDVDPEPEAEPVQRGPQRSLGVGVP
jgi:hypothetical protein